MGDCAAFVKCDPCWNGRHSECTELCDCPCRESTRRLMGLDSS